MPKSNAAQLAVVSDNKLSLSGSVDFDAVSPVLKAFSKQCGENQELEISLAKMDLPQTVVLSLLLEMQRMADKKKTKVRFLDVPESLQGIAVLKGVDDFVWG